MFSPSTSWPLMPGRTDGENMGARALLKRKCKVIAHSMPVRVGEVTFSRYVTLAKEEYIRPPGNADGKPFAHFISVRLMIQMT